MAVTVQFSSVALDRCDRGVHVCKLQQHLLTSPLSNWLAIKKVLEGPRLKVA